ncbi:MAG TPA: DUF4476 domain-containing protein [Chitinophagaceae bacterium]|nr:DUF4476 domain-containing protein [Chitinophagaceae bacterium]
MLYKIFLIKKCFLFFSGLLTVLSVYAFEEINPLSEINSVYINKIHLNSGTPEFRYPALQIINTDQNNNSTELTSSVLSHRNGNDMLIKVNRNDSLDLAEIKKINITNNLVLIAEEKFDTLLNNIKNLRSANARSFLISNAFNTTNNTFSSNQVLQLLQQLNDEKSRLQLAKLSYNIITDRNNFYKLYVLLSSKASKNELTDFVNNYQADNNPFIAMDNAVFQILYLEIKNQRPESTRMNSLINVFNTRKDYFSAQQSSQLIQLVKLESNRLQLAKLSYHIIVDLVNFSQIYNLFGKQINEDKLADYVIANYSSGSRPQLAMSDVNFNNLFISVKKKYLPVEQMNFLTEIFNNARNYFTCSQANKLIPLITYESNRLLLAKLAYRTVTDRGNFNLLTDLLNSQASKNDLMAYTKAYKD